MLYEYVQNYANRDSANTKTERYKERFSFLFELKISLFIVSPDGATKIKLKVELAKIIHWLFHLVAACIFR